MKVRFAVASDMGRVRKNNEDAFLADPVLGIFAVADGMGGHASGEVASRLAIESLQESIARVGKEKEATLSEDSTAVLSSPANLMVNGIRLANQRIYKASQENREYKGMGTTLVAVYFSASSPIVAHVGDSRLYHLRGQAIQQVTEDHSWVWEQYKQGLIAKEALSASPHKNIVTRALGIQPTVDVDIQELEVQQGDFLLLCSDGLSDLVRDEEMLEGVSQNSGDLNGNCNNLIHLANFRGGKDNITVLLIQINQG
ncbi:MAG: Stp1/IreP family PP2C-type Ser/Thr phosphatase [Deltaproteobacteria bacterium]|nr:Stp1/IreP family PP2C-type Ser/Thr phosphatase [Deltaproteobacteria bacterium]